MTRASEVTPADQVAPPFGRGDLVRHVKSQGLYRFIGVGRHEATLDPLCAYESVETGELWFRVPEMMFDGRFELVERAA